jgi:hypothetical protein
MRLRQPTNRTLEASPAHQRVDSLLRLRFLHAVLGDHLRDEVILGFESSQVLFREFIPFCADFLKYAIPAIDWVFAYGGRLPCRVGICRCHEKFSKLEIKYHLNEDHSKHQIYIVINVVESKGRDEILAHLVLE